MAPWLLRISRNKSSVGVLRGLPLAAMSLLVLLGASASSAVSRNTESVQSAAFVGDSVPVVDSIPVAVSEPLMAASFVTDTELTNDTEFDSWQFTSTADPLRGGSIAIASVSTGSADALVRCWTESGEMDLRFLLAPTSGRAASNEVSVGFDKRRDVNRTWRLSPSGLALVVPLEQRRRLLRRLQAGRTMRLNVFTGDEVSQEQLQLNIPLSGSSQAIRSVLNACN